MTVRFKGNPTKIKSDFKGTRVSYFAWTEGRFVGMEDTIDLNYEADASALSAAVAR